LEVALGVAWVEGDGNAATEQYGVPAVYYDAVGDLKYLEDPVVAAKYGPSISHFQVRALRDPNAWGALDKVRIAALLTDPQFATYAAYVISKQGTDWSPWTAYRSGSYLAHKGRDYILVAGHPRAGEWSK